MAGTKVVGRAVCVVALAALGGVEALVAVRPLTVTRGPASSSLPTSVVMPSGVAQRRRSTIQPLQMNLFERFLRVGKANLNNLLNRWEDPEKVLTQAVEDGQKDLVKVRQSYAEVMASQKRLQRQREEAKERQDYWQNRAQLCVGTDESLARAAIGERTKFDDRIEDLDKQIKAQGDNLSKLYEAMQALEGKIAEARATKDQYVARARTAKTTTKVNDMLSSVTGTTSMDAFERMKDKVEMLESQAEVSAELAGTSSASSLDTEAKFRQLEASVKVEEELQMMKNKMLADSKAAEESAATAEAAPAESSKSVEDSKIDAEFEKMKQEMSASKEAAAKSSE